MEVSMENCLKVVFHVDTDCNLSFVSGWRRPLGICGVLAAYPPLLQHQRQGQEGLGDTTKAGNKGKRKTEKALGKGWRAEVR